MMNILQEINEALASSVTSESANAQPAAQTEVTPPNVGHDATYDEIYSQTLAECRTDPYFKHPANAGMAEKFAELYARMRTQ